MSDSKVARLDDALSEFVHAGDHAHFAYSEGRPNAAVLPIARRFRSSSSRLTISSGGFVSSRSCLVSEGIAEHLMAGFVGDNYPNGAPKPLFERAIDSGDVSLEEDTPWTMVARLAAGVLGIPFLPVNSLQGTDLAKQSWVGTTTEPVTGTTVSALTPDVTIVHAVAADRHGNVILSPSYGEASWGSIPAKTGVIAVVQAVVDDEVIGRNQTVVGVPSHVVKVACAVPFGAHRYCLYSTIPDVASYVEDEAFILDQRADDRGWWSRVPFVACAGERVSSIVTAQCVLERDTATGNFVMTGVAAPTDSLVIDTKEALDGLGCDCAVVPDLQPFDGIRDADLSLLRSFDPRHTFLSQASGAPSHSRTISNQERFHGNPDHRHGHAPHRAGRPVDVAHVAAAVGRSHPARTAHRGWFSRGLVHR